jgi:3-oxoacyl-[acyl-carrier protein] reductase
MSRPGQELRNQFAVITGASSGIGAAIAQELARAGAHCFLQWRQNRAGIDATADAVRREGVQCETFQCDLSDETEHARLVEAAWKWSGNGIDVWVNNAGADILTGKGGSASFDEKLKILLSIDVVATMRISRFVGEKMTAQKRGCLVNIGWDQAEHGMAGDSGELFAATKGAVMAFTKSLAKSLAPAVRANCVAPGWIKTSWGENASEYWQSRAIEESALRRWGTPEDIAQAVRFLASDAASFITGHVLPVNGGYLGTAGKP